MYQFKQITNSAIGAVAANEAMPLGTTTHQALCGGCNDVAITTANSGGNTITLNDAGYYKITYNASVVASAAGVVTFNLVRSNAVTTPEYTVSQTATAAGDTENLTLVYIVRVLPQFFTSAPVSYQIVNAGVALTSGTSNTIIEKIR